MGAFILPWSKTIGEPKGRMEVEKTLCPHPLILVEMNPDHCYGFGVRDRKRWMGPSVLSKELTVPAAEWLSKMNLLKDLGNFLHRYLVFRTSKYFCLAISTNKRGKWNKTELSESFIY